MKKILFLSLFLILSVFVYSCSDSGGDDGPGVPLGGGTGGEVVNPDPGGQVPDDGGQTPDDGGQGGQTPGGTLTGFPQTGDPSCSDDVTYAGCGNFAKCYDYALWPANTDDVLLKPDNYSDSNLIYLVSSDIMGMKQNDLYLKNFTYDEYKAYVRRLVSFGYSIPHSTMVESVEEALAHPESDNREHSVSLVKNTTFSIQGVPARHAIDVTYYTDDYFKENSGKCGVSLHKLQISQSHRWE